MASDEWLANARLAGLGERWEIAIRSRLEICSWLILEGLSWDLNRAFSIRNSMACGTRSAARKRDEEIVENLRLGIFSSLILMGLTRNSNSRFAIRTAEMRLAADGGHRGESPLIRTTHVTLLVTICQDRMRLAP